jgi:hypothetical protein
MSEAWNEGWVLEEAMRRKWCPDARVANRGRDGAAINRTDIGKPYPGTECMTTQCVAWEARPGRHADRVPQGRCLKYRRGE